MATRVVYIMGYGRSGSTVLDTVLGAHPSTVSVGELAEWMPGDDEQLCACGETGQRCPFWKQTLDRWRSEVPDIERYLKLRQRFETGRGYWRLLWSQAAPRGWDEYEAGTRALYRSIAEVSGQAVVVDSSKRPARALALSRVGGLDPFLVHLVRDGRGVAWSLMKSFRRDAQAGVQRDLPGVPVRRTAALWTFVNLQARAVTGRMDPARRSVVRYEDYLGNLRSALDPLGEFLGGGVEELVDRVDAGSDIEVGHTIAGNRLRMQGQVRLRPDVEWMREMSSTDRRRFWRIAGRLMRSYGYAK